MTLREQTIWWSGLLAFPMLAVQAVGARRRTPLLASAPDPHFGVASAAGASRPRLATYLVGESTAAGVGASGHEQALSGQLARRLAERSNRPVRWSALGLIGARARELLNYQVDIELPPLLSENPADLIVVALGVNDTTKLTSRRRWRRDLNDIIERIRQETACPIVFTGVPPMEHFAALPQPLRSVMGARAQMLDRDIGAVAARHPNCHHHRAQFSFDRRYLASDGFHPSELGYALWAEQVASFIDQKKILADT